MALLKEFKVFSIHLESSRVHTPMNFIEMVCFYQLVKHWYIFQEFLNTELMMLELEFILYILKESVADVSLIPRYLQNSIAIYYETIFINIQ